MAIKYNGPTTLHGLGNTGEPLSTYIPSLGSSFFATDRDLSYLALLLDPIQVL